jgi:glycosyltransferase involved in cell wall biosynthesis
VGGGHYTNANLAQILGSPMDHPTVSVIIPARDAAGGIVDAIRSVVAQRYDGALEIIVAEGRSSDETRRLVEELADAHPDVRLIDNPSGETAAGLNAAIAASSGEVIVRCDAHALLPIDYVATAVRILSETKAANVGGVQKAVGDGLLQRAVAIAMTSPLGVGDARFHYGGKPGPVDTVYLGTFDRSILEAVGGFDERLIRNQDYELNHRLRSRGHVVWFDPSLVVTYSPRSSLTALWSQYFDYGRWKRTMLSHNPSALRWRQMAPIALVIGLIASLGLAVSPVPGLARIVPGAYASFVVLGTLAEAVRRKEAAALLLPVVLPTMHLAWGVGFLVGSTRR